MRAVAAEAPHRGRLPAVIARSQGLRIIFDDGNTVFCSERKNGVHVGREAEQVDGDNRARAGCDPQFNLFGVEIERSGLDIRKHWPGAQRADSAARGDKSKRRYDDFIPCAYAAGMQRQFQCFGS